MFKKAVYWIRYGVSFFFLWPGFWIEDFGTWVLRKAIAIQRLGDKIQDLAVAIEGPMPNEEVHP